MSKLQHTMALPGGARFPVCLPPQQPLPETPPARCPLNFSAPPSPPPPLQAISQYLGNKTVAATRLYWSRHRERLGLDGIMAERAAAGLPDEAPAPGAAGLPDLQAWAPLLDHLQKQAAAAGGPAADAAAAALQQPGAPADEATAMQTDGEAAAASAAAPAAGEGAAPPADAAAAGAGLAAAGEPKASRSAASLLPKEELAKLQTFLEPGAAALRRLAPCTCTLLRALHMHSTRAWCLACSTNTTQWPTRRPPPPPSRAAQAACSSSLRAAPRPRPSCASCCAGPRSWCSTPATCRS